MRSEPSINSPREKLMNGCMADDDWAFILGIVLEVAFDLTWSPASLPAKLKDQLNSLLRSLPVSVRGFGFDA